MDKRVRLDEHGKRKFNGALHFSFAKLTFCKSGLTLRQFFEVKEWKWRKSDKIHMLGTGQKLLGVRAGVDFKKSLKNFMTYKHAPEKFHDLQACP